MQLSKAITIRFSPEEVRFLEEQAEIDSVSVGQAARKVIQTAILDGRDAQRLSAVENRLSALIQSIPNRVAEKLVQE
ncbi:hypothetical protein [Thiomonas intermedia]|uniref:hypothetical protein n=1 Tax=Thiomonas intermedia TaxID=926 RepID=UPI0009A507CC|nr:hypothetical protein [Thiomonas intermedia]